MANATITGPIHPLLRRIRDGERARDAFLPAARKLLRDHHLSAASQSVYRLLGGGRFQRLGSYEDEGQRVNFADGVIAVSYHRGTADSDDAAHELAETLAMYDHPDRLAGGLRRARALRDAAEQAAPLIAVLLAVCARAGTIDWDTGETVQEAARRLALDAGWRMRTAPNPGVITPAAIFANTADALNLVDRPAEDYARAYLDDREAIDTALAEQGIEWGGPMLTSLEAADHARVASGTWRAYAHRDAAPAADHDGRWRVATVDAWRLTRTSTSQTAWWTHRVS